MFEKRGALGVVSTRRSVVVLAAVEFDDQTRTEGQEIRDVRTERDLSAEVEAAVAKLPQQDPEFALGVCLVVSEVSGEGVDHA